MADDTKATELARSIKAKSLTRREGAEHAAFNLWLDRKLHEMFDSVTAEPLPEELVKIVRRLG